MDSYALDEEVKAAPLVGLNIVAIWVDLEVIASL